MERNVEHIIKNYQYFELNEAQKDLISEWAKNSDEFEALQNTLLASEQFVQSEKEDLNPVIKQRLDVRFAEKHDQNRLVWYNKLWIFLWPNESPFYKRPLIQFGAICLIIAITIPLFPDVNQPKLAMNDVEMDDKEGIEEKEMIQPKEESLNEDVDKKSVLEEKEIVKEESNLRNNKSAEILVENEPVATPNQKGWKLNEERSMAGAESRPEKSQDALKDIPQIAEDQVDANYNYDKSEMDAPAIEQLSANRLAENVEVPKKVETKETLGFLTALY